MRTEIQTSQNKTDSKDN